MAFLIAGALALGTTLSGCGGCGGLDVPAESQAAGAAIDTAADDGSSAQRWHVMPMGSGEYNVENMLTHQVIGPGGQSVLLVGSQAVMVYHCYDGTNNGTPTLGANDLQFDSDGWPSVQ